MTSSSSRFLSRLLLFLFLMFLMVASFNLPLIFNSRFLKIKNGIEKESSAILDKNVCIGDIGFLPYGMLILNDIKIQDIEISRFNIRFNILEFLINRKTRGYHLKGVAVFKKPDFIGQVKYKLNVIITPDAISIRELCLDFTKFDIDIKGNINDYTKNPIAELNIISKEISISGIAKIDNIYSSVRLSKDELFVKDFNFFLNDFPLGLTCKVSNYKSPSIELNIMSYPDQLPSMRPFNRMNFELNFSGKILENSMNGDLTLKTQKLMSINPRKTYCTNVRLYNLSCIFSNKVASVNAKNIICETAMLGKEFYLSISDFNTLVYLSKAKIYLTGLSVLAYKGLIKGNGFLDFNQWPTKLLLDFKVYKLDVMELAKAMKLNYELKGELDFKGVFNNRRDPCLSGRLDIRDGYLKNTQVLAFVSDFLNVPSLKSVYFKNISSLAYLSLINKEIMLDKITVTSQDMNLNGNIRLKNTKKINGNISFRLSTELLKESFKLRLLFHLIGEKLGYQDFEFEIGGFINSPQIKWLSTRFKDNVVKYLTGGNKKYIERSLEHAIEQLTK